MGNATGRELDVSAAGRAGSKTGALADGIEPAHAVNAETQSAAIRIDKSRLIDRLKSIVEFLRFGVERICRTEQVSIGFIDGAPVGGSLLGHDDFIVLCGGFSTSVMASLE
ncbi:MAG: hypothetical protein HY371_05820 [Devosia nanyangense]|nr:hypothetical protein [Devosia nanyangense]